MLPHEFNERANRQNQRQTVQRLQFQAWCRAVNLKLVELPQSLRFEVRIDSFGFNHLHVSTTDLGRYGMSTFPETVAKSKFMLYGTLGQLMTWEILQYLGSAEAIALYELELLAG